MASELTLARAFVGRKKNAAVADSEMEGLAQQMVSVCELDGNDAWLKGSREKRRQ